MRPFWVLKKIIKVFLKTTPGNFTISISRCRIQNWTAYGTGYRVENFVHAFTIQKEAIFHHKLILHAGLWVDHSKRECSKISKIVWVKSGTDHWKIARLKKKINDMPRFQHFCPVDLQSWTSKISKHWSFFFFARNKRFCGAAHLNFIKKSKYFKASPNMLDMIINV